MKTTIENRDLSARFPGNAKSSVAPGPKGSLLLGVMSDFNRDTLGFITRCRDTYGDVVRMRFLYLTVHFLYHPDDIEYVLSTNAKNFLKSRSLRSPLFQRLVGRGLLTSEGEFWRRQRRLAQPAFHRQRINSYGEVMVNYTERMISMWKANDVKDIHREMMRLTLEIVVKTLFNADVSGDADRVGRILSEIVKPFASQATLKWIADNRLPTMTHRNFSRLADEIDTIVYRIIGERRTSKTDEGDLLSMMLQAQDEDDGGTMTDRQLRDEVMTLFLAGHETSALTLSWAWWLLAQNPDVEKRFHNELDKVLQGRPPTLEDYSRLKFTEMIAKESMRLYPPAFGVGREAIEEFEVSGFRVPAKSQIFMFQWATQRDPRFFSDPDQFKPGRWSEGDQNLPRYAYFPFGGGPRVCIGNYFAMIENVLLLATIGQRFRLRRLDEQPLELYPAMSLRPRGPMNMRLELR
jgi:cytochrome P450